QRHVERVAGRDRLYARRPRRPPEQRYRGSSPQHQGSAVGAQAARERGIAEAESMSEDQEDPKAGLRRLRERIDSIDAQIQALIADRARCAQEIGTIKGLGKTAEF